MVRDCVVDTYSQHGIELDASTSAAELLSCTDANNDGVATAVELPRLVSSCIGLGEAEPPSIVTLESRRELVRGC